MKVLTLFGGIGAVEKAFYNLNVPQKLLDYVEIDEKAVRSYNSLYHDLQKKTPQSVIGWNYKPDILFHGSPCQDYSRAGNRWGGGKEDKTRSSLIHETVEIVRSMGEWQPTVIGWENVTGVLDSDMVESFEHYLEELHGMGYIHSVYEVLDARDFGIPQARKRIYVISTKTKAFDFSKIRRTPMRPLSEFLEDNVTEPRYMVTQPSMLKKINTPENMKALKESTFKGAVKIIDEYAYTITTKQMRSPNAGVIRVGKDKYRYLTERECWRLMGFTDEDFDKVEKEHPRRAEYMNGTLYMQAGNSIVVPVLESIFEGLFDQCILEREEQ